GQPATAEAEVVELRMGNKTAHAVVRFTPRNGREVRLRRDVPLTFEKECPVGSRVTVEYLPRNPQVGRIRDFDLDGRNWLVLLFVPAMAWISYEMAADGLAHWLRPLRAPLRWKAEKLEVDPDRPRTFRADSAGIETLAATLPERHRGGAIVFG